MKEIYLFILLIIPLFSWSQKHDYNWMMGDGCGLKDSTEGIVIMNFSSPEYSLSVMPDIKFEFLSANTSVSDSLGNLQFYCNGNDIFSWQHELMENGGNLIEEGDCEVQNLPQGVVGFLKPDSQHEYILINIKQEVWIEGNAIVSKEVFYNKIDMSQDDDKGSVVIKKELIVDDYLNYGQGMVCQHANGRDWWLLLFKFDSNEYYRFLIDPNGVQNFDLDAVELPVISGRSQSVYSPNGEKFAQFNAVSFDVGPNIDIFDFDRCTGTFTNQKQILLDEGAGSGGAAFSPNSRFLYVSSFLNIYQYDMWAVDIEASRVKVAEYDDYLEDGFWTSHFHLAQLAPNNKIYITTPSDGHFLHVIHNPDEKGLACNVELRGLEWPTWKNISIPNFPHYRMGALEGSPCDSLSVSTTSIPSLEDHLNIYPNPNTGQFTIQLPALEEEATIVVSTLLGKTVHQEIVPKATAQLQIDLIRVKGVFFVNITNASGFRATQKIIVQ